MAASLHLAKLNTGRWLLPRSMWRLNRIKLRQSQSLSSCPSGGVAEWAVLNTCHMVARTSLEFTFSHTCLSTYFTRPHHSTALLTLPEIKADMYSSALFLAALAAVASADMQHLAVPGLPKRAIQARQTDTDLGTADATGTSDAACDSAYSTILSLYAEIPTPAADVESYLSDVATSTETDVCSYTVPASLSSDYDAWTSDVLSWYSGSAGDIISSAVDQCTDLQDEDSSDVSGVCTSGDASGTASGVASASATTTTSKGASETTKTTGSKTTDSSASATTTHAATQTGGAAMREVGMIGAVFAGVLGAVVAL